MLEASPGSLNQRCGIVLVKHYLELTNLGVASPVSLDRGSRPGPVFVKEIWVGLLLEPSTDNTLDDNDVRNIKVKLVQLSIASPLGLNEGRRASLVSVHHHGILSGLEPPTSDTLGQDNVRDGKAVLLEIGISSPLSLDNSCRTPFVLEKSSLILFSLYPLTRNALNQDNVRDNEHVVSCARETTPMLLDSSGCTSTTVVD